MTCTNMKTVCWYMFYQLINPINNLEKSNYFLDKDLDSRLVHHILVVSNIYEGKRT